MFDKLIELVIQFIRLFRIVTTVKEFEEAVILRFGKVHRIRKGGLAWLLPLDIDDVYLCPLFLQTMIIGPQSLVTKDGHGIVVSTLITHTVRDSRKYVVTIQGGEQAIEDIAYGVVSSFVRERTWDELCNTETEKTLLTKMRQRADDYGVFIKLTQIIDFTKSRSIRLIQHAPNKLTSAHIA